jgi:hypothetical protein
VAGEEHLAVVALVEIEVTKPALGDHGRLRVAVPDLGAYRAVACADEQGDLSGRV